MAAMTEGRPVEEIEDVSTQAMVAPPTRPRTAAEMAAFEAFYRENWRRLVRIAVYLGAIQDDAEDAAEETMTEVFQRWGDIESPLAFARRAVVSHFLKEKTRGTERVRRRLVERGERLQEGQQDARLTLWEDRQWVTQLLRSLPPTQRDVMAFIVDEFSPTEVATLFGSNPPAIRQNLLAARRQLQRELQYDNPAKRTVRVEQRHGRRQ
jgi:RNA polymerase sigma factor (sigma-70 family)